MPIFRMGPERAYCNSALQASSSRCDAITKLSKRKDDLEVQLFSKPDDAAAKAELATVRGQLGTEQAASVMTSLCGSWPVPPERQNCDNLATIVGAVVEG